MRGARKHSMRAGLFAFALLISAAGNAEAQHRFFTRPQPCQCPSDTTVTPPTVEPTDPKIPPKDLNEPTLGPVTSAALGDSLTSMPQMMGDFAGYLGKRIVLVPTTQTIATTVSLMTTITTQTVLQHVVVYDPIASRAGSGFKVADNEDPRPVDRVFFTYNYFSNIRGRGGFTPGSTTVTDDGVTRVETTTPGVSVNRRTTNVDRELFGFEKTFLGGNASIELRLPVFQASSFDNISADDGFNGDSFGDMTIIMKYALFNDRSTGNVFSAGLAITAPTGPAIETADGNINSTLIQPFIGYVYQRGDWYFQGIHSIVIPTNTNDATVLFNDLATGYVFRTPGSRCLAFVAPCVELHVTTPLDHRSPGGAVIVPDILTVTGGLHFGIGDGRPMLSIGVAAPVTGPRPYDLEAFVQLNFRF